MSNTNKQPIVKELKPDGVLVTYSDGSQEMENYEIDENGKEYIEIIF